MKKSPIASGIHACTMDSVLWKTENGPFFFFKYQYFQKIYTMGNLKIYTSLLCNVLFYNLVFEAKKFFLRAQYTVQFT